MPNYVNIYLFRLDVNNEYHCVNYYLGNVKPCEILRLLGLDFVPEGVEFIRFRLGDGKAVWVYFDALSVRFKFININIIQFLNNYVQTP